MTTLHALLKAYLDQSLSLDEFSKQFIEYWNEIRVEQNKAINDSGIRETLDSLWKKYKSGMMDEVDYGMQWTEILTTLPEDVRILPQSIVFSLGNELYSQLIMHQEGDDHLDAEDIPTEESIEEHTRSLLDSIEA